MCASEDETEVKEVWYYIIPSHLWEIEAVGSCIAQCWLPPPPPSFDGIFKNIFI